jgi:hypothetical protein
MILAPLRRVILAPGQRLTRSPEIFLFPAFLAVEKCTMGEDASEALNFGKAIATELVRRAAAGGPEAARLAAHGAMVSLAASIEAAEGGPGLRREMRAVYLEITGKPIGIGTGCLAFIPGFFLGVVFGFLF